MAFRVVIWGPGEVGGAALRAAHASPDFEVVGVKVYSPHKHGRDAGDLVGIGPIGVIATNSKQEILALDADCVIVAPQFTAVLEGLDDDVIDILESGKSVVTTAAYHNVSLPNWHNSARTPTERLRAISRLGAARNASERRQLAAIRALTAAPALDWLTNPILASIADKQVPARATPDRLLQACRRGDSSLHGAGVHPTFMVERLMMRMCAALDSVSHVRFVEALDFSYAPDGMWGGLDVLGFGRDVADIDGEFLLAKAGDFYYGDLTGNVGHSLFGVGSDDVRIERTLRAIPAKHDFQVGSTTIRKGTAAVLHMTHRGYRGDGHHFFTNEESWFLGVDHKFHGDAIPFAELPDTGGYSFEITGEPATIRGQLSYDGDPETAANPITAASVRMLLDAIPGLCTGEAGIVIDDSTPKYRVAESDSSTSASTTTETVFAGPADDVIALLKSGTNVVTTAGLPSPEAAVVEACRIGGTTVYAGSTDAFMIERVAMTMIQGMLEVDHIDLTITGSDGDPSHASTIANIAETRFGDRDVRVEREPGVHRGYHGQHLFITITHRDGTQPVDYALRVTGAPVDLVARWEIDVPLDPSKLLRDAASAVRDAAPGILVDHPAPAYQLDDRLIG
jgi:2,4-diaminopentanoate dehydrogenase